jgi:hypothetical protein
MVRGKLQECGLNGLTGQYIIEELRCSILVTFRPPGQTSVATTTMLTLAYILRHVRSHSVRWVDGVAYARPENDIRAQSDVPPEA